MLNAREKKVMNVIYYRCFGKGATLISPVDLLSKIPESMKVNSSELAKILKDLSYDGYIDVVETDKKGEFYYCITLQEKGSAFPREMQSQKRTLYYRITMTVVLAVFSFVIGIILKNIF